MNNNTGDKKSTARNICSVENVQMFINNTDTSLTALIQQTITNVSSQFENYCQRGFKFNTYTGFYDGDGSDTLYLYQYPIISLTALQYRTSPNSEWTDFYTGSATANIFVYDNYIQLYNSSFTEGKQNIKVVYNAGYEDCPGDLKQIAIENVTKILTESNASGIGKGLLGVESHSVGGGVGNENYSFKSLEERTKKVLDQYRRIRI